MIVVVGVLFEISLLVLAEELGEVNEVLGVNAMGG